MRLRPNPRSLIHKITIGVKNIHIAILKLEQSKNKLEIDLFNQEYIADVQNWTKEVLYTTDMEENCWDQNQKLLGFN